MKLFMKVQGSRALKDDKGYLQSEMYPSGSFPRQVAWWL